MKTKRLNPGARENIIGYSLIAPAVILILLIGIVPIFNTFSYSLQNYVLSKPKDRGFVGLENDVVS